MEKCDHNFSQYINVTMIPSKKVKQASVLTLSQITVCYLHGLSFQSFFINRTMIKIVVTVTSVSSFFTF